MTDAASVRDYAPLAALRAAGDAHDDRIRVRNFLQILWAVASRSVEQAESALEFADLYEGRFDAISHSFFEDGQSLGQMIRREFKLCGGTAQGRVRLLGAEIVVPAPLRCLLALCVHELAVNAFRYGALSIRSGVLDVRWKILHEMSGRQLVIVWEETGGRQTAPQNRQLRFAREIVETALPFECAAQSSFLMAAGGLRCWIRAPLP